MTENTSSEGQPTAAEKAAQAYQAGYAAYSQVSHEDAPGKAVEAATEAEGSGPAARAWAAMYLWGWNSAEADRQESLDRALDALEGRVWGDGGQA